MSAAPLIARPGPPPLLVASELFGPLRIWPEDCLIFPDGLLGFAAQHRYVMLPAAAAGVYWLQSCDEGSLVFLVADPFPFVPDYAFELPDGDPVARGAEQPGDIALLAIVTLPDSPWAACTMNLQGPLVVNLRTRLGCQRVRADELYGPRHPIDLRSRLAASSSGTPRR
ncbi:MAG TPA: flagellar assembly protein FliW [Gemmatimonadales bacterium]|nr:flagellar assembly protein FliW [Gemmatimonadales bacterium]